MSRLKPFSAVILFAASSLLFGCGPSEASRRDAASILTFACRDGKSFRVEILGDRAIVHVEGQQLDLSRRPSSFTRGYGSANAMFIQDGEQGFLTIDGGGSFNDCRER
jgi:hypothetical protein